ncbi:Protein CBG15868 [Caenorhabditis briggsae]|uniref:Protein CBG15868 n=1 Tax=Caenorhabditis briggsae TaxID=6238 RepID=A8XMV1_CAEBR|nr:Protein CBG15868 [Caenorhabditis briggsae]CAP33976.1 Protein CBG15868 [Caenorhabditis briggsae]
MPPQPFKTIYRIQIKDFKIPVSGKFFSNTQAPVCGSTIFILLKRYPNEADISRLVSLIRSHHSIVHVKASAAPSGGSQPKTMYSVSSKTNGMGLIENDDHFGNFFGWFSPSENPFPVYATTIQVSGSGTKTLPDFHPLISDGCSISITYQDHVPDDSLQNITLRWTNPGDSGNFLVIRIGGKYLGGSADFMGVNYKMALDYNYLGQDVQNLQIRIYSNFPLTNNWLPYKKPFELLRWGDRRFYGGFLGPEYAFYRNGVQRLMSLCVHLSPSPLCMQSGSGFLFARVAQSVAAPHLQHSPRQVQLLEEHI